MLRVPDVLLVGCPRPYIGFEPFGSELCDALECARLFNGAWRAKLTLRLFDSPRDPGGGLTIELQNDRVLCSTISNVGALTADKIPAYPATAAPRQQLAPALDDQRQQRERPLRRCSRRSIRVVRLASTAVESTSPSPRGDAGRASRCRSAS